MQFGRGELPPPTAVPVGERDGGQRDYRGPYRAALGTRDHGDRQMACHLDASQQHLAHAAAAAPRNCRPATLDTGPLLMKTSPAKTCGRSSGLQPPLATDPDCIGISYSPSRCTDVARRSYLRLAIRSSAVQFACRRTERTVPAARLLCSGMMTVWLPARYLAWLHATRTCTGAVITSPTSGAGASSK